MTDETFDLQTVLARAPFAPPNVRSSVRGNIVHIGVLLAGFRLRAACHAETTVITMAQPTGDIVSCSNCLSRERRGLIPHSSGLTLPPHLVLSALSIWRTALDGLRSAARDLHLRQLLASLDDGTDLPQAARIPEWLGVELVYAFDQYREVADGPVVEELVNGIAAKIRQVALSVEVPYEAAA
jgi:hypothetical protein